MSLEDLGVPPDTWGGTIYAINNRGDVVGYTIQTYGDGNGRRVTAATRYTDIWSILWTNSAFDAALGLNDVGDAVGVIGFGSATRGALYVEGLNRVFLMEDLTDPPGYTSVGNDINDAGWIAAGATNPACDQQCAEKNATCSTDGDCCSGVCKKNGTCR